MSVDCVHEALRRLNGGACPLCDHAPEIADELPRVLVADPPWSFDDALPGDSRGAEKNYRVLTLEDIRRLQLPALAPNCHLFMWRVSAMVEEAYSVIRAWGFVPKSELVWRKLTTKGRRWFGMGRHVRMEHETCVIAVRGSPKVRDRATRSVFDADEPALDEVTSMFSAPYSRHSAKPNEFYSLVERLCPGPYVELFARRQRPGWTCLGDQVPGAPTTIASAE